MDGCNVANSLRLFNCKVPRNNNYYHFSIHVLAMLRTLEMEGIWHLPSGDLTLEFLREPE